MLAVLEPYKVTQTVVATLAIIEEFKPEQHKCVNVFIKGKDIVYELPTG